MKKKGVIHSFIHSSPGGLWRKLSTRSVTSHQQPWRRQGYERGAEVTLGDDNIIELQDMSVFNLILLNVFVCPEIILWEKSKRK